MADAGTELSIVHTDDGLALAGELDAHTAPRLQAALTDALRDRSGDVRLRVEQLTFMDSSGLRIILDGTSAARKDGRELVLVGPTAAVRRLVEITGLAEHIAVADGPA